MIAYPAAQESTKISSKLGEPIAMRFYEAHAWHMCKAAVEVLQQYPEVTRLDPSCIFLHNRSQPKITFLSPVIFEELYALETFRGRKITFMDSLNAPELMIKKQVEEIEDGDEDEEKVQNNNSLFWSVGFILYNLLTGDFPYANLEGQEKLKKLSEGPPPDFSWFKNNSFIYEILSGCIIHDPKKRITLEQLTKLVDQMRGLYEGRSLMREAKQQFHIGVLINTLFNGEWYTVQVLGARQTNDKQIEIFVNYMIEGKTEWILLNDRQRLRGFTKPYKIWVGRERQKYKPDHIKILDSCPKFVGPLPDSLSLHEDEDRYAPTNYQVEDGSLKPATQPTTQATKFKQNEPVEPINLAAATETVGQNYLVMEENENKN
eukprot:TRINITY_DN1979_c0_g1_i10.p1 TRINITY_DN1979_c0_g1~~TRINITY_DN1979_c0_g1_i10.p1  ORF type:complete len:375 (-),score=87.64 TRINITY_DN1979_c0_g1_i10:44-1168(-)